MHTITRIAEQREQVTRWRLDREGIAFVPTMGNLHMGHASLMAAAHLHGRRVISSIFVNPMQFGPSEDFSAYPRTPDDDANLLREYGVDALFQPTVDEMYPEGSLGSTVIDVPGLTDILCGVFRPGHFQGVATVVVKLLCLVQPDVAIFGEKDFQQLTVIRRVVQDLNLPVKIVGAPTVRGDDGLALSSRNRYLTPAERTAAPAIYRALDQARRRLESGDTDYVGIEQQGADAIAAAGLRSEYFEVRTADRLAKPAGGEVALVVLAAARLGKARLIDNLQCTAPVRN
ncbi:MAG: pantoate--beta-alanine ligase [Steroidobacteraceae bacterium]